jgi:pimeloyl-ACP methyl ester carboxylesterase
MEEKIVELSRGLVPYLVGGSGPTILFFHGAIAMPQAYLGLFKLLEKNYRIYAPTHPGHGNAFSITKDWKLDDYIDTYQEFIKNVEITPHIIMGHSFGGLLSLLLAPFFLQATLVVMDAPGLPLPFTVKDYVMFMFKEAEDLIKQRPDLAALQETVPAAGTLLYTIVRHPEDMTWFPERLPTMDISDYLKSVKNKTILLWGNDDKIIPIEIGKKMEELLPHSRLITLFNKGHLYPVTDPQITYKHIQTLLGDHAQKT